MLRTIEAEERLASITDRAMAAGTLPRHDASAHHRRLRMAARGGERRKAVKADPRAIARMGIAVRMPLEGVAEKGLKDA